MIFIIGCPRSGTTWLQSILGNHPDVATAGFEITLVHKYLRPIWDAWSHEKSTNAMGVTHGLPAVWSDGEFEQFTADFIDRVYRKVLGDKSRATHVVEKYPQNAYDVEFIRQLFPEAKLIHIIRDGRKVALSLINVRKTAGFGSDSLPRAIKYWKKSIIAARKGRQYQGDYTEIRYEDLLKNGEKLLPGIIDFCGLSYTPEQIREWIEQNSIENKPVSFPTSGKNAKPELKKELTTEEKLMFDKIAGDLLVELGYANKGWWHSGATDKWTTNIQWYMKTFKNRLNKAIS
jgi:hypothetical protein